MPVQSQQYIWYHNEWIPQKGTLDGNSTVEITASENHIGEVSTPDLPITVTPTLDTNAYVQDDILFDTTEIPNAARVAGGTAILQSLSIIDKSKNNDALKIIILNATGSIGTANAAENISDANGEKITTEVEIAAGDYVAYANFGRATKNGSDIGMGILMKPASGTSLYVAAVYTDAAGATYGASDIVITFGFLRS